MDETYVKVAGRWRYVYRAIGQHGPIIDVDVSARHDAEAGARRLPAGCPRTRRCSLNAPESSEPDSRPQLGHARPTPTYPVVGHAHRYQPGIAQPVHRGRA